MWADTPNITQHHPWHFVGRNPTELSFLEMMFVLDSNGKSHLTYSSSHTPQKTNMEPKNGGLEDDFPFQTFDVQVPC